MTMASTAVFCWIVFAIKVTSESHGDEKIQKGDPVDITKYPYVGSMQRPWLLSKEGHRCMTVLISPKWALTAAHCIVMDSHCLPLEVANFSKIPQLIVMGSTDLTNLGPNVQKRDILKGVVHPQYTYTAPMPYPARYDLGAVTLKKPFTLNRFVGTAPLFPSGTAYWNTITRMQGDPTENCRIVGWGSTINVDPQVTPTPQWPSHIRSSPILLQARFVLINHAQCCQLTFLKTLCLLQIGSTGFDCCLPVKKGSSSGGGDSGGPVVCKWHVTGNDILVGIHQGGHAVKLIPEGDIVIRPNLYIKTGVVMDWIPRVTGLNFAPIHTELGSAPTISPSCSSYFLVIVTLFYIK